VSRPFYISIFLFACTIAVPGQVRVVDASSLTGNFPCRFLPDVEGKVAVHESYFHYSAVAENRDAITVFPGWPVPGDGSNERGGIYANLDDDPEFEVIYPIGAALYALNIDGTDVNGWPQVLDYPTDGAAAFGDIDGDGFGEIVVTTHEIATFATGSVYAFERNGAYVTGFPVTTEGGGVRTPVLADINGDEALEIVIAIRDWPDGLVSVYGGDGMILPNWPQRMDYVPGSAVAVGDIDNDGIPEIVAESYYSLHVFATDGTLLDGFPYLPGLARVFSYSSPVLADLDDDGNREIICGDHSTENGTGAVHVVRHDGTVPDGWPKITAYWIYGPPAVGDINGDGLLDIAVGDQTLSITPVNKIYAWTGSTADTLDGFPIDEVFGVNSQIILADLDGDNRIELMSDDNVAADQIGHYRGYNHDGTPMADWPLETLGSTFFINPFVADIDLDGILDISGGGTNAGTGVTNLYLWNAHVGYDRELAELPILQYNTRHNGVYGDVFMVGIKEQGSGGAGELGSFKIHPNPASDYIWIIPDKKTSDWGISVSLYNIEGILLYKQEFKNNGGEIRLNLERYPFGVYWIRCEGIQEEIQKFIKF
jgi:hypothetical protein